MADRSNMIVLTFLLCSFHYLSVSHGADSITGGKSIRFGQNLTSSGGTFQLGFFTPGNSSKSYVGIWYTVSKSVIVWVANRDKPVSDSSGVFTLRNDGNLVIMDGMENLVWDTNTSSPISSNLTLHLQNDGNLVLSNSSTSILWKSFDHPTDTFLPGMEIGLDQISLKNMVFTSWRSPVDPSSGNFTLRVDPTGSPQIYIWNRERPFWRSGQWNAQKFSGITNMGPLSVTGFRLNDDGNGRKYFVYSNSLLFLVRFVIQWNGSEHQFLWIRNSEKWVSNWTQPANACDFYNTCGNNGICNIKNSPRCSCLRGFQQKSNEEWNRGIFSGGCVRITPLKCKRNDTGEEDGFLKMESVKLPNFAIPIVSAGKPDQCKDLCLKNCSCTGYSFNDGNGCMIWGGDFVDNNQFVDTGETFYLRLAGSELSDNKDKRKKVLLIVLLVVAIVLCLPLFLLLKFRAKVKVFFRRNISEKTQVGSTVGALSSELSCASDFVEVGKQEHTELSIYSFSTIEISTNNFSSSNKLGQGGFGPVYMGKLPGGQEVAVKRLSKTSGQGLEEFKNELILIAKLQHRNLVRLIGWCIEGDEKILIYEYMPNKSLDAYIFGKQSEITLNWNQRFNIIEGIARGLLYLHRDSRLRIIHRDLKASNILLDEELNPKISDFGMAKIFGGNENQANTNRVVGTYGYMSPEYAMEGLFSIKSDVYSFGVLLLEIVSGKRNPGFHKSELSLNLIGYAWDLWKNDKAMDLVDPSIRDNCSSCEVMRCIHVGLLCVQDLAMDRPTMSSVVLMLGSEATLLPTPKQPNFSVTLSSHIDVELPMGVSELFSSNSESVSTFVPR